MEAGSSSLAVSGSPGSNDSLHGLKFGQKIYFEDMGNGGTGSSSTASMASSASTSAARKGKNQGVAHPPRCQVEGCMVDLSHAKAYHSRHKVCGMHSKSPKVIVAGLEQRFCQQCSRFHQLPEFDHGKRSCRRKLAGHNERRRKPPAAPLLSRTGRILSSLHGDNSRPSCSVLDIGYPKFLGASIKGVWPAISFGSSGNSRPVIAHQLQGGFSNAHVSMEPASPGRVLFSSSGEVLQGEEYLSGVSESSCALSLLSSQTWGTTFPARTQGAFCFNRPQFTQTVISNDYMNANSWSFKDHFGNESGGDNNSRSHLLRNVMELNRSQFSGELERLALEGSTHNMELDPGRCCGNSLNGIHWSL